MKYLCVSEDGELSQTNAEPSENDLQMIENGALSYVRLHNGVFERCVPKSDEIDIEQDADDDSDPETETVWSVDCWETI